MDAAKSVECMCTSGCGLGTLLIVQIIGICIEVGVACVLSLVQVREPLSQQCHRFLQLHTCMSDVSKGVLSANLFQHSNVVLL